MGHDQSKPSKCERRYNDDGDRRRKDLYAMEESTACSAANLDAICPVSDRRSMSAPNENDVIPPMERSPKPKRNAKHFLTRRERVVLLNCWKRTKKTGPDHIGIKIFYMILTAQPDIKDIFDLEKVAIGQLKYDARFRQQAAIYTKTFDYIMKNLDYPDKLESHFVNTGKRHAGYQKRGFTPEYWDTFVECMTQAAAEWDTNRTRPSLDAWRNLVDHIIAFMRRGFDEENARRRY